MQVVALYWPLPPARGSLSDWASPLLQRRGLRALEWASGSMRLKRLWALGLQQLSTQETRLRASEAVRSSAESPV